ncbi:putative response regulator receiver (CheY-like protein) [Pacificimonas flava]|uniref:Putative response regulator receiver (CheY-like protein) n=1 Tax=Pacificimonas flava TaxID=1234595 RepID=M2SD38_9SPHN|nr:putative response regulator receiver (CheY-like protein) [Pacificimonas flava]
MLAAELQSELSDAGAVTLGPVGTVEDTLDLIQSEQRIDGAILDVNLRGKSIFPAADLLAERAVPFVFATGYDEGAIPSRFADRPRCEKPIDMAKIKQAIGCVIHA